MFFDTLINIIAIGITAGTPLLYVTLGEVLAERSGVMNLALEGLMLIGAVTAFITATVTHDKWIALLVAAIICALLGLIVAVLTVSLRVNQIVAGIALTIFLTGLSSLVGNPYVSMTAGDKFEAITIPFLHGWIATILNQNMMVYLAIILAILIWVWIYKTKFGLYLRAAGENPSSLDTLGINVFRIRYGYVIVGAMLAGMGGAYLSLSYTPMWIDGMSAGRGWIAIALVNFAIWEPYRAIFGSYLFGAFYALSFRLAALGVAVPSNFLNMLPYILPVVVLIVVSMRAKGKGGVAPKALGLPYVREKG